ncbi:acetyltransferase [Burkholderia gladioli]|uniref:acetyltransferase n=1 Tax=Burkholderia gladioli TaxID=28095 RepID=UPI0016419D31|nr:acetyltransferase [Burkholderia gladioli]
MDQILEPAAPQPAIHAERYIVAGGGAFARELINWAEDAADAGLGPRVTGFLDVDPEALSGFGYALDWHGDIDAYQPAEGDAVLLAIGEPRAKAEVVARLAARGARFGSLRHPSAVVARRARLGIGVVICPNAVLSADCRIGDFAAVNILSSVGHDVTLGAYATLSSHVDLTGHVVVGERVFFGSGARVLPRVTIGADARIGAGAVVMRRVPEGATLYAAPAKRL